MASQPPGTSASSIQSSGPVRRDFLLRIAQAGAAIGTGAIAWTLIDSMNPSADVVAAGAPVDLDLSKLESGQQIVILWRGKPILIINRPPAALARLREPASQVMLRDPNSDVFQQPEYARNWHRSLKPEYGVLVGICTHLGCLPIFYPKADPQNPAPDWQGGYFCPCHGSKYDLAGRVFAGVPAPYNLPVPPYRFMHEKTIRVGENPPGQAFDVGSVVQL